MNRSIAFLLIVLAGCSTARDPVIPTTFDGSIENVIAAPPFDHGVWAILVEDDDGTVRYARNAHALMIPASNRKLFSAAAAVSCLGFDARLATELWIAGQDVILRGGGDPSLGAERHGRDVKPFAAFLDALRARGVTTVRDVVADVSAFDRWTVPGGWKVGNLISEYSAPVDALAWQENAIGEYAVASPAWFAAQAFRTALENDGIPVTGSIRVEVTPNKWSDRVAIIESPTLFQLLPTVLQNSHNLYAEMLLKDIAMHQPPATYDTAFALERQFLVDEVGIDPAEFRFADGSGLAPDDLVTPAAIIRMLRWLNAPERRGAYWLVMAGPGQPGTLRTRLTELTGRLRGKTGTINGVNALSGVIALENGRYRYFSIIVNHHNGESGAALNVIDSIVRVIAR